MDTFDVGDSMERDSTATALSRKLPWALGLRDAARQLIRRPAVGLCALATPVLLVNPSHLPALATVGAAEIRISDLLICGVIAVVLREVDLGDFTPAVRWLWLLPFALSLFISAAVTAGSVDAVIAAGKVSEWLLFGVAVTLALRSHEDFVVFAWAVAATSIAFGAIGAAEVLIERTRAVSLIGTNVLGMLGAFSFALLVAVGGQSRDRYLRLCLGAGGALCLVSSASIGATLASLAVAAMAIALSGKFRPGWKTIGLSAAVLMAMAVTIALLRAPDVEGLLGRTSTADQRVGGSLAQRAMYADIAIRMWLDDPVLGVGFQHSTDIGSWLPLLPDARADFPDLRDDYFPPAPGSPWENLNAPGFSPHTLYVQLPAEVGLTGTALFVFGIAGFLAPLRRRDNRARARLAVPLIAALVGFLDHELYGGTPDMTLLVLSLAVCALVTREPALEP